MSSRSCRPASPRPPSRSSAHRSAKTSTGADRRRRSARVADELDPALVDAEQFTFLGRGWTVGLAHEAALKMREASQSWTESYPAMEYRHGPIAIAAPGRVTWHFGEPPEGLAAEVAATGAHFEAGTLDPMAELVRAQRVALARRPRRGPRPRPAAQPHPLRHPRRLMDPTPTPTPAPLGPGEAVLAFDVGGTDTKSALVDADGTRARSPAHADPLGPRRPAGAVVGVARRARRASTSSQLPDVRPRPPV